MFLLYHSWLSVSGPCPFPNVAK